ncbi:putative glutamine transport system substrate-binding protein [Cyclonatronum proteinivorum]|uniref:Putative glutamine transport system substrate-binding protein n=1 Tax=Cyclonatronum proteinivorum TaxID=1457365 RepID=A0A345UKI7_9BACT|nr:transporter substrate-binding domain-containing protein [Cyclonatronum proteinivorum]AXJ00989.1 putative glutamine transport system substrate-binding protein [Cyclonatronum proteinivorum]
MKLKEILLATLFLVVLFTACSEAPRFEGDSFEQVKQRGYGTLTVVYVPAEGFAYIDERGNLTGVTIDIMEEFREFLDVSMGLDITYNFVPVDSFQEFYGDVVQSKGGVFGLGNVTITEARKSELRFSPPYLTNIAVLITNDAIDELGEMSELSQHFAGMNGLAFEGTLHQERIERLISNYIPEASMEFARSNAEILEQLSEREDLFAYIDIYNFWRAAERGKPLRQHTAGDLASERFGIIMPLNSDWQPVISDFFERGVGFRTSNVYRGILERHLGEELTERLESAREAVLGD